MVPSLTAQKLLASWSWENIIQTYYAFGVQITLAEEEAKKNNIRVPLSATFSNIPGTPAHLQNVLFLRASRINKQLQALDFEIARRKKLVGVLS